MKKEEFNNKFLIIGTAVTSIIYLTWRIFFTIPFGYGIVSLIAGFSLLIIEIIGMIESAFHYKNMSNLYYPKKPEITDESLYPHVDVFIATYNEPEELLYKTVNGCLNMDYPDKNKVHIYICDDSNRVEMKNLASRLNINYITRTEHKGAKAGNLNNALSKTSSPLIATFDADMIPMHDFLMTTVPYFIGEVEDEYAGDKKEKQKIGFVQTPQSFYNSDLFQYNLFSENRIPNEQDYFYRDIQVSKNKTNSVIYGGSNTVISREALDEIGGFYTKVITEDFATGLLIQSKGYRCYAINEIHAAGLSPEDLSSLIKQRERWARGCIQTGRKLNILFIKGLNLKQKISYLISITYWYSSIKRLAYILSPILYSVFGIVVVVKCSILEILIFWLPMYIFNDLALKKLSNNIRNTKWSNIYETILFPSLIFTVILETFGISKKKFSVTKKEGAFIDKRYQIKKALPHIVLAIFSLIGIIKTINLMFGLSSPVYGALLFWLLINFYNILMSIFFMFGRWVHRKTERFYAKVDCEISFEGYKTIKCKTHDISEGGIGVALNFPEYIPYDEIINIKLNNAIHKCEFKAQVSNVHEHNGRWMYGIELKEINEKNFREFLIIIYDREPNSPKVIEENSSIFDDIRVNIKNKRRQYSGFDRKLPRIILDKDFETLECGKVTVVNFNYEYVLVRFNELQNAVHDLTIKITNDILIRCHLGRNIENENEAINLSKSTNKKNMHLYVVENYKEISKNESVKMLLCILIMENNRAKLKRSKKKLIKEDEIDELSNL